MLGKKESIDMYYQSRKTEINLLLDAERLQAENRKLADGVKNLEKAKKELRVLEASIREREEACRRSSLLCINLSLPINKNLPISNDFIDQMPSFMTNVVSFAESLSKYTDSTIAKYKKKNKMTDADWLHGYLLFLCTYVSHILFNPKNVRVHIRCLDNNGFYVKLIASLGEKATNEPLTPINSDEGMIYEAGKLKCSLIKSLNPEHHIEGRNDHIWKDYMTMVFDRFYYDEKPAISMGISVNDKERYKYHLYFLNYFKIEQIIQTNLTRFKDECGLNILELLCKNRKVV